MEFYLYCWNFDAGVLFNKELVGVRGLATCQLQVGAGFQYLIYQNIYYIKVLGQIKVEACFQCLNTHEYVYCGTGLRFQLWPKK